jgi:hypothetical protein
VPLLEGTGLIPADATAAVAEEVANTRAPGRAVTTEDSGGEEPPPILGPDGRPVLTLPRRRSTAPPPAPQAV